MALCGALDAAAGAADIVQITGVAGLALVDGMLNQYLVSDSSANKLLYIL